MTTGLILLEGPDGVGKTTLAKAIVEKYDGHYMHMTYRWKNKMFTYHAAGLNRAAKLSREKLVVLDRQWMSEEAYAQIYRGGSLIPHAGRMHQRVLNKLAAVTVVCLPGDWGTYQDRFNVLTKERVEMYEPDERMMAVARWYDALWHGKYMHRDWVGYGPDLANAGGLNMKNGFARYTIESDGSPSRMPKFIGKLGAYLEVQRQFQSEFGLNPNFYNFLGYPQVAKYLFVGDRINKTNRAIDYPFYAHHNSSLYISKCLSDIGFDESLACWTNINDQHGMEVCEEMINHYGLEPICFGGNAHSELRKNYPNVIHIHHPSYARRFMPKHEYIKQLKDALNAANSRYSNRSLAKNLK